MTSISSVTLEVAAPSASEAFYAAAFDLGDRLGLRHSEEPTTGFRGFTMSLVVSQPGNADALLESAIGAGARTIKPAKKSVWGYGGVVQAPDGTIWKVATSSKKDRGPATRHVEDVVLLLGVSDFGASKRFYVERGLKVDKSFGKYAQFELPSGGVKLALYGRGALAKDAGVDQEGSGSHRIAICADLGSFTDPDGFNWEAA
ncbi:MAG TPA: hypothetical protein VHS57_06770 [Acidimicrobiales bacterium]|nr:hypothetical protein [Acidimicrobiales bacterium]